VGGGRIVDIRLVDMHRISRYLSKYLTKELLLSAPKRSRRVTVSRGYAILCQSRATGTVTSNADLCLCVRTSNGANTPANRVAVSVP
jgi:hypothetical protein